MICTWSQFASPEPIDILGASGFDFTIIDTEHGCCGLETVENLAGACDAAGLVAIVRIRDNQGYMITKGLDIGAAAVLIPKISSADEAASAVSAASAARVAAFIETPAAIERIFEITAVPGLQAILAGPFDLSVAMGLEGDTTHRRVQAAFERVLEAADGSGVRLIMPVFRPQLEECRDLIAGWTERGVRLLTVGTVKLLFAEQCSRFTAALRGR
jgi:4-hydroxy-2-oxoheptanedioate aldolase